MDILNKEISKELKVVVSFDGANFVIVQTYDGAQVDQELKVSVQTDLIIDSIVNKAVEKNAKLAWLVGVSPFVKNVLKMLA
jgi:hypothetical protein